MTDQATAPEIITPDDFDASEFPYKFEVVALELMFVDDSYQRPLTSFVNKIVAKFDPALVGTLVLSHREPEAPTDSSSYAIVDGQTRQAGMVKLEMVHAPCLVFYGLTQAAEAALFAKLQKERRGIASYHRFRAARAGGEEEPIAITRIARDCGYEIGIDRPAGEISAVAALESLYREKSNGKGGSPQMLQRVLTILHEAWDEAGHVPDAAVLRGMGYFVERNPDIDDERMADHLHEVTPTTLKRRASALQEGSVGMGGGSNAKYMAGAIHGVYQARR